MRKPKSTEGLGIGQTVSYKKQGQYGSYTASVVSIGKRVRIRVRDWCGLPIHPNYEINVKSNSLNW